MRFFLNILFKICFLSKTHRNIAKSKPSIRLKKYLLSLFIISTIQPCESQSKDSTSDNENYSFSQRFYKLQKKYDSFIILNNNSFKKRGYLKGIGTKGDNIFELKLCYKKTGFNKLKIKSIKKTKTRKTPFNCDIEKLSSFNNDSLNLFMDTSTKIGLTNSGGKTVSIFYFQLTKNNTVYKKSYMPNFYQERYPTKDREDFIQLFECLNDFLK